MRATWDAYPLYTYQLRQIETKGGRETVTTYEVVMIDGSPYYRTLSINDVPVPAEEREAKLRSEIERRRNEAEGERQQRIAKFQRERRQDQSLLDEMANAFDFHVTGDEAVNGRACYVLTATPRAGYRPKSRETKVLTGMRGQMWVDQREFQWVRVHAEVFRPVSFGLFIAEVHPGTKFLLEMSPAGGNLWFPSHFEIYVKSSVLFWSRESREEDFYSQYRLANGAARATQAQKIQ